MRVVTHTVCAATNNPKEEKDTRKTRRVVAFLLAATIVVSLLASCSSKKDTETSDETQKSGDSQAGNTGDSLVYASGGFSSKFSPFFYETVPGSNMATQCTAGLLTTDQNGSVILKGIEGETREYNGKQYTYHSVLGCTITENSGGTVYYDFKLKDGAKLSDGEPLTVNDVIFSMCVYSDPTYDGSTTFFTLPIQGMGEYRAGVDALFNLVVKVGENNTDFSKWTEDQQRRFWESYHKVVEAFVKEIVDFCITSGPNKEGDSIAAVAASYGYPDLEADATAVDLFDAMLARYGGSVKDMSDKESAGTPFSKLMGNYQDFAIGVETGTPASNISGIQKTGDNTFRIVVTKVDTQTIYQIGIVISPPHYYSDKTQYGCANNKFGSPKGDLGLIRSKTSKPLGAGPYVFNKYENGVVSLKANPYHDQGEPKTKNLRMGYISQSDCINPILAGMADVANPFYTNEIADAIKKANSNGEISGDKIYTVAVDALGYGYIGMNSYNILVNKEPDSDTSKNLRRGFATIFAAYRDLVVSTYYGDRASVINYLISNTSWAAPQPTDDGCQIAFSKDVNGNPIYTSGMSDEDKYAAAKKAMLGFSKAAGYKIENGKTISTLEGAKMGYTIIVSGGGTGDRPSFMITTEAQRTLADIGMKFTINDLSSVSDMWNKIQAGQAEIQCAAWQSTPDPDMYQIYYSDVVNGGKQHGGSTYHYQIEDADFNGMILQARESVDQEYRKTFCKACLNEIVDWACEAPVYQRQGVTTLSAERIKTDTTILDITSLYKWYAEIKNLELSR